MKCLTIVVLLSVLTGCAGLAATVEERAKGNGVSVEQQMENEQAAIDTFITGGFFF